MRINQCDIGCVIIFTNEINYVQKLTGLLRDTELNVKLIDRVAKNQ